MRYAELFGKTRREAPGEITDPARRLAYRAGLLRLQEGGNSAWLPLAARVFEKMAAALRRALTEAGAQQLRATGKVNLSSLAAQEIQSYKQLPSKIFWLDAGGTRIHIAGFESTRAAADETVRRFDALSQVLFETVQISTANADDIAQSRVWYAPSNSGTLEILRCSNGDYAATRAVARAHKDVGAFHEMPLPRHQVETPHSDTIESLAHFLGVPTSRTAKAVFYSADGHVIFAVVRGDLQIDEEKLKRALRLETVQFATDDEIARVGATPGYASPVGVRGATIVVDDSIVHSPNLVAGANRAGYHLLNTNVPRDYQPDLVTDIALAREGDPCPNGDGTLELARGRSLGLLRGLSELDASYLDANGRAQKVIGVSMMLDLGEILLGFIDTHHDDKGILWKRALAPYDIHIVALNADKPEVAAALNQVTGDLKRADIDYLLDDRNESAGVKFNDADLIGLPVRVTIGPRTVAQNSVEVKRRDETNAQLIPLEQVISSLK